MNDEQLSWLYALDNDDEEKICSLLKNNAQLLNEYDSKGSNSLMMAVNFGARKVIKLFIEEKKIDIDVQNLKGESALMLAANNGDHGCVADLLKGNANPNLKNIYGDTALHLAILARGRVRDMEDSSPAGQRDLLPLECVKKICGVNNGVHKLNRFTKNSDGQVGLLLAVKNFPIEGMWEKTMALLEHSTIEEFELQDNRKASVLSEIENIRLHLEKSGGTWGKWELHHIDQMVRKYADLSRRQLTNAIGNNSPTANLADPNKREKGRL